MAPLINAKYKRDTRLIRLISRLPGLDQNRQKGLFLKLINNKDELVKPMASTLAQVYKNIVRCQSCGSLKSILEGLL